MGLRPAAFLTIAFVFSACFAKLGPEPWLEHSHGDTDGGLLPDGGRVIVGDAGEDSGFVVLADGGFSEPDGRAPQPIPTCSGVDTCLPGPGGLSYTSATTITCSPEPIVGPWTLILEKEINKVFVAIQTGVVQAPGFGASFTDPEPQTNQVTYRICVQDVFGTRCGVPFDVDGVLACGCEPRGCEFYLSCNTVVDDGCSGYVRCGACANGATCNDEYRSCCPLGLEPDGDGLCVCAPPSPCPRGEEWDVGLCECQFTGN